jgi:hypothetical protein
VKSPGYNLALLQERHFSCLPIVFARRMRIDSSTCLMPTWGWRGKPVQGPKTRRLLDRKLALECLLNSLALPHSGAPFLLDTVGEFPTSPRNLPQTPFFERFADREDHHPLKQVEKSIGRQTSRGFRRPAPAPRVSCAITPCPIAQLPAERTLATSAQKINTKRTERITPRPITLSRDLL